MVYIAASYYNSRVIHTGFRTNETLLLNPITGGDGFPFTLGDNQDFGTETREIPPGM